MTMKTFATIVEDVQSLSFEEMNELDTLLEKFKIEKRREEIANNHKQAIIDNLDGKLKSFKSPSAAVDYLRGL